MIKPRKTSIAKMSSLTCQMCCFLNFLIISFNDISFAQSQTADESTQHMKEIRTDLPPELSSSAKWVQFTHGQDPRCDWSKCQRTGTDGSEFSEGRFKFYLMHHCMLDGKMVPYAEENAICGRVVKRPIPPMYDCDVYCYSEGINVNWDESGSSSLSYLVDHGFQCNEIIPEKFGCFSNPELCVNKIKNDPVFSMLTSEAFVDQKCQVVGYRWGKLARDPVDNKRKFTSNFCFDPKSMKTPVKFFHDCGAFKKFDIVKTEKLQKDTITIIGLDDQGFNEHQKAIEKVKSALKEDQGTENHFEQPLTGVWEMLVDNESTDPNWQREIFVLSARRQTMYGYAFNERPVISREDKVLPKKLEAFRLMEVTGIITKQGNQDQSHQTNVNPDKPVLTLVKDFPKLSTPGRAHLCILSEFAGRENEYIGHCENIIAGKNNKLSKRFVKVRMKKLNAFHNNSIKN